MKVVTFSPDLSYSQLSPSDRKNRLLSYEAETELSENILKVSLNVIFNSIELSVPDLLIRNKYYFGLRRASIEISVPSAILVDSTDEEVNITKIESQENYGQGKTLKDENVGRIGMKDAGLSSTNSTSDEKTRSQSTRRHFEKSEKPLIRTRSLSWVKWEKSLPRASGEYSSALEGNLELYAMFETRPTLITSGKLVFDPMDIKVFDSEKQITQDFQMIAMVLIFIKSFKITKDRMEVNFKVNE